MTVEPGFGGQSFMDPRHAQAAAAAARRCAGSGLDVWLQVDGGISERTIAKAAEAGADTFVAGSSVFGAADPRDDAADRRPARDGSRALTCTLPLADVAEHKRRSTDGVHRMAG